jgi:DhnA family fructose-bisphosphate aldolase class Ia
MSFCSAFGQWDATAHQQLFPFDMASWMLARGASGVGGGRDIHHRPSPAQSVLLLGALCGIVLLMFMPEQ